VASTNMKAVVTLTADASGVSAGVNRALGQLQRLQDGVSQLRSMAVAGMLANVFGKFASGAMDQANQIMDAARTYSPEGMRGAMDKQMAETESMMELGKAFGNIVGLIDQAAAAHIRDLTKYLIDNKEPIGQALAMIVGFGMGLADVSAQLLVGFGKLVEWVDTLMSAPMTAVDQAANSAARGEFGLQVQGAGMIYELLRRKMGGE
jgi:hypothetical protein